MAISDDDLDHLGRCVGLACNALESGDEPFGSILVDRDGKTHFEDRNRVAGGNATRHPEIAIARWAAENLTPAERAEAASSAQLTRWLAEWGAAPPPVAPLPIAAVAPGVVVDGPADGYSGTMKSLYEARFRP